MLWKREMQSPWTSRIISAKHSMTREMMESDETTCEIGLTRLEAFKTKIHRSNTLTEVIRKVYFKGRFAASTQPTGI